MKKSVNNIQPKQNSNNKRCENLYQNLENDRVIPLTQSASKEIMEELVNNIQIKENNKLHQENLNRNHAKKTFPLRTRFRK